MFRKTGISRRKTALADPASVVQSYFYLAGVEVMARRGCRNRGHIRRFHHGWRSLSVLESNSEWPAVLAARLQANKATAHIGIANAGISGNRILGDNGGGMVRFFHDVLDLPGVRWVTLLEGIKDISGGARQRISTRSVRTI